MGKWKRDRFVSSETPFKKWIFQNLETYSHEFVYITTGFFLYTLPTSKDSSNA